jgi:diguanylate cyclase (GGDEF)-like protein/PAS domain S-box-containing protein
MSLAAALIYWVIISIWLAVLGTVAVAYYKNPRTFGTTRLLLIVVSIDTIRNIIENLYFGLYFGAQYGFFPASIVAVLGKPGLLIIPKLMNVVAASVVLGLLLFRWLPMAMRERFKAESAVREKSEALEQETEEHRRLFDTSVDLIVVTDRNRIITRISPSCVSMLGYQPDEMLGRYGGDFIWQANIPSLKSELELCVQGKAIRNFQSEFVHKDGRKISVALAGVWSERAQRFFIIGRDMTEQNQAERMLATLAHFDQLTGLPNRNSLLEDLGKLRNDNAEAMCIAMFDLDGFKNVNDTLGHSIGDKLLTQVGQRIEKLTPESGRAYRLGGDEFVLINRESRDLLAFSGIVDAVLKATESRFEIDGHAIYIGASAGIAIAPADGSNAEELIGNADLALYEAKAAGGRKYRLFARAMRAKAQAKHEMEGELRRAFANREFVLHFQPQFRLSDGVVVGAEALLRWQHPQRGLLSPAAFIDALIQSPAAVEVGDWILRTACETAASWISKGLRPVRMAVNLFPAQFHSEILSAQVDAALKHSGLPPELLEIEVTENIALNNDDAKITFLQSLRAKGVGLAFDDFGTGYASLSCLTRYPLTRLKIDRAFVQTIDKDPSAEDTAVASSIIVMAHNLGLSVTAEGVETAVQEKFLQAKGCHEAQGFLYSRPLPIEQFEDFLTQWQAEKLTA